VIYGGDSHHSAHSTNEFFSEFEEHHPVLLQSEHSHSIGPPMSQEVSRMPNNTPYEQFYAQNMNNNFGQPVSVYTTPQPSQKNMMPTFYTQPTQAPKIEKNVYPNISFTKQRMTLDELKQKYSNHNNNNNVIQPKTPERQSDNVIPYFFAQPTRLQKNTYPKTKFLCQIIK